MLHRWLFLIGLCLALTACQRPASQAGGMPENLAQSLEPTLTFPVPAVFTATSAPGLATPMVETPAPTLTPTPVPIREEYALQMGSPVTTSNFLHPESSCSWAGVSGQVFDPAGNPVKGLVVRVSGILDGVEFDRSAVTGTAEALGPGGFEVVVSDQTVTQPAELEAQVFAADGVALSAPVKFQMPASCEANLVLINFVSTEIKESRYFIPVALQGKEFGSGSE